MSRTRAPTPLSSFNPRFRELLLAGAVGEVKLTCSSRSEATKLRQRLNQYRFAVKQHSPDDTASWEPLYRCIVQQKHSILVLRPRDSEFENVLDRATMLAPSITPSGLPPDFLDSLTKEEPS